MDDEAHGAPGELSAVQSRKATEEGPEHGKQSCQRDSGVERPRWTDSQSLRWRANKVTVWRRRWSRVDVDVDE